MSNENGHPSGPTGYEEKFAEFIRMCREIPKGDKIVVANPHDLGDTYEELIESLNRIADAEAELVIVPRSQRGSHG